MSTNTSSERKISLKEFLGIQFNKIFTDSIPIESVKLLPFYYKYGFGAASFLILGGAFLYFVVSSE